MRVWVVIWKPSVATDNFLVAAIEQILFIQYFILSNTLCYFFVSNSYGAEQLQQPKDHTRLGMVTVVYDILRMPESSLKQA